MSFKIPLPSTQITSPLCSVSMGSCYLNRRAGLSSGKGGNWEAFEETSSGYGIQWFQRRPAFTGNFHNRGRLHLIIWVGMGCLNLFVFAACGSGRLLPGNGCRWHFKYEREYWEDASMGLLQGLKKDELGLEIAAIALPAALALTADPIASLIDTAFIGHIGPVELAGVGAAIAVFNQVSKIAIFPLVSVTTSAVAEEDATGSWNGKLHDIEITERSSTGDDEKDELIPKVEAQQSSDAISNIKPVAKVENERRHIPSASSALVIGAILGLIQALFLIFAARPILDYMGIKSDSLMLNPARRYLTLRSLGAPAVLLSLAMQGIFRGFKDTKTPLYANLVGNAANIILDPVFIFVFRMGVSGAAIAHVTSQYLIALMLLWRLMGQVSLIPPSISDLNFSRFLKNGFLLFLRVIAATFCVTLAASLAARLGSMSMAAFQICLQVWLATSLLADGLAIAGQAILASAFAKKDFDKAVATTSRVLQLGLALGLILTIIVAVILQVASRLFTEDDNVLLLLSLGVPFVVGTQPINALAFVFDGINFGASDFAYSAYSMIMVSVLSTICLFLLSASWGLIGIWIALSIFMSLRALAGFWRIGTGAGPWSFLKG